MARSRSDFIVPRVHRVRDLIFSLLIKAIVTVIDRGERVPSVLSSRKMRSILNAFAQLYGFHVNRVLQEEAGQRAAWNLLKSVSDYGIGTPQRLKAPVSVVWSLSHRCNLMCKHCYQNASQRSSDELTLGEQFKIIDQLAQAGVSLVVLSGGEPLTNPNLGALIQRVKEQKMAVSIDSNGVLLNKETVQHLRQLGVDSIELSLDSVHAEAHDSFRGLDGAFQKTLEAVELCSDEGIFTTVATTATKLNYPESRKLISLARSRGAQRIVFFDLIPAGRGRDIQGLRLSRTELIQLMAIVRKECSRDGGEVFAELPQYVIYSSSGDGDSISNDTRTALSIERFTLSSFFDCAGEGNIYRKFAAYLGGCPAGRIYCNIQPNGDVTPCMFMPDYPVAGNLRNQSFLDIWNSPTFEALRDRASLQGKCHGCRFAMVCGGCRAKAAAYEGNYLASDPTCSILTVDA
jgi:radical SAM protein with 4Fe4S-binding SPASM domain